MSRPKTSSPGAWGPFLRGVVGGIGLTVVAGSYVIEKQPAYFELAFSSARPEDIELDAESIARINRATELFMDAFILVERQHVEAELGEETIDRMLDTALAQLDPYSGFFDKEMTDAMTGSDHDDSKLRLGVLVMDHDDAYSIEAVTPGSAADLAGLKPGDKVVRVGKDYVGNLDPREINERIGAAIAALQDGTLELGVVRHLLPGEISLRVHPSPVAAIGAYHLGRIDNVLMVHLERFYEGAAEDVAKLIRAENAIAPLEGVALDLRNDGGGLTTEVRHLAELFLAPGSLLYEMSGRRVGVESVRTEAKPEFPALGLSVIINKNSASASEIFAGAIQAHNRGDVVGWRSFGKGTVQRVYPLDGGAVKITVAQYRDGGLRPIDGIGVNPDIEAGYADPGHRPSRFSADPVRDKAIKAAARKPYVTSQ